jgi:hypothetical protein
MSISGPSFIPTVLAVSFLCSATATYTFPQKLNLGIEISNQAMEAIWRDWDVSHFPQFLESGFFPKHSWDRLVDRFQEKVLFAAIDPSGMDNFTVSFMGSSVTAGYDVPYKLAFPFLFENRLKPVLDAFNVHIEARNVAMGNNPCLPYNGCVRTFAGRDADVVHFEHFYDCGYGDPEMMEVQ